MYRRKLEILCYLVPRSQGPGNQIVACTPQGRSVKFWRCTHSKKVLGGSVGMSRMSPSRKFCHVRSRKHHFRQFAKDISINKSERKYSSLLFILTICRVLGKLQHKEGVYKKRKDVAYLSGRGLKMEYLKVYAENLSKILPISQVRTCVFA